MSTIIRNVEYTGAFQTLTVTETIGRSVTAYLRGGGGGGGPGDGWSGIGGTGGGGGYTRVTFDVNPGDRIGIAVGQGGGRGFTGSGTGGGRAGASYTALVWDSLSLLALPDVVRYTNGRYTSFLNQYGVWNGNIGSSVFDRTVAVYFPESGNYVFTGSCDNYAYFYVDGVEVLNSPSFTFNTSSTVYITAGFHNIRLYGVNTGGPGCVALSVYGYSSSYSGAAGGSAGGSGSSGSGAGGGGATLVTLNDTVIAVAGGGGGGGGAGRFNFSSICNAPGQNVRSSTESSGQAGQSFSGDGGGGGGGGGGYRGGNGGAVRGYEETGVGGAYGSGYTPVGVTENPSGQSPGGLSVSYLPASTGVGGIGANPYTGQGATDGTNGYAAFEFNVIGSYINQNNVWKPVRDMYVHHNSQWNIIKNIYMRVNDQWKVVINGTTNVPQFVSVPSRFGVSFRPY